jgi:hypothetical protein
VQGGGTTRGGVVRALKRKSIAENISPANVMAIRHRNDTDPIDFCVLTGAFGYSFSRSKLRIFGFTAGLQDAHRRRLGHPFKGLI